MCNQRHLLKKGDSKEALKIPNSKRHTTAQQYQYPWKGWMHCCTKQQVNPIAQHEVFDYSFFWKIRLIVSQTRASLVNTNFTGNAKIVSFMKRMLNLRPTPPKYRCFWDVQKVSIIHDFLLMN